MRWARGSPLAESCGKGRSWLRECVSRAASVPLACSERLTYFVSRQTWFVLAMHFSKTLYVTKGNHPLDRRL